MSNRFSNSSFSVRAKNLELNTPTGDGPMVLSICLAVARAVAGGAAFELASRAHTPHVGCQQPSVGCGRRQWKTPAVHSGLAQSRVAQASAWAWPAETVEVVSCGLSIAGGGLKILLERSRSYCSCSE
ncbi:hypothetical protein K2173_007822 [Erythroxylum novogranatense]|uniref:Uncharacterized protein n=1 Tax=Erythroxylum novogranatense TaxID=1862640 RepID=A0AAV8TL44_9ROSI|nr:hypothetical protein K2173_007822 [Erythroxylum novogranatense]